jgi:hypothetical protein
MDAKYLAIEEGSSDSHAKNNVQFIVIMMDVRCRQAYAMIKMMVVKPRDTEEIIGVKIVSINVLEIVTFMVAIWLKVSARTKKTAVKYLDTEEINGDLTVKINAKGSVTLMADMVTGLCKDKKDGCKISGYRRDYWVPNCENKCKSSVTLMAVTYMVTSLCKD